MWTGTQDIVSPRRTIILQEARNSDPPDASINLFLAVNWYPTPIFSKVIFRKTVPNESDDVYARKRFNIRSNSVVSESPSFTDFRLLPANKMDKLKTVISRSTRVVWLNNVSKYLSYRPDIEEVQWKE